MDTQRKPTYRILSSYIYYHGSPRTYELPYYVTFCRKHVETHDALIPYFERFSVRTVNDCESGTGFKHDRNFAFFSNYIEKVYVGQPRPVSS